MKYLKKFETTSAYNAAKSNLILPNVSYCISENYVYYKPKGNTPPTPSHDYVEIGGIKWATMNIGATAVTDNGLYFQWGDTQGYTAAQVGSGSGQKAFSWADYKFNPSGDGSTFTKYNEGDELITLESTDDAVTTAWGGNWRMPTVSEFITLNEAVTSAWTADYQGSGVAGVVFTSIADTSKKLFFPACGLAIDGSVDCVGSACNYWSSSLDTDYNVTFALGLSFDSNFLGNVSIGRENGFAVRGVLAEN